MQIARCVAILWSLAVVSTVVPVAWAQQASSPPLVPITQHEGAWTTVLTPNGPVDPSPLPAVWSAQDVEAARARCATLLKGLDLVAVPAEPIREGPACGAPAPMQLVSVGSNPPITFSPPAILTCDMIAALHKWLQSEVQPLARKHLGTPVVSIKTMSSFSCRNAYGRAKTRLSEHGRVNALDFGAFLTANGETTMVVADWGPSARELAAEAVKRQAEAAASARKGKTPADGPRPAVQEPLQAATTIPLPIPRITIGPRPSGAPTDDAMTGLGWAPPSRLGGPKEADAAAPGPNGKAAFLRAAHKAACGIFSTALGPEANRDHNNHFHLDMADRKSGTICK